MCHNDFLVNSIQVYIYTRLHYVNFVSYQAKMHNFFVACLLGNVTGISGFRIWKLIYCTLPVVTTIIHFTTLQHINQRLVFSVRYHFRLLT
jgi:hypothetical protein